jgi:uncharacterized membrane protein
MTVASIQSVGKFPPWRPTLSGLALGLLFWLQAATPTLIPRTWAVQAAVSGVALAVGYGIGTLVGRVAQSLLERWGRSPGSLVLRRALVVLGIVWLLGVVTGALLWVGWQNDQRDFMGMTAVGWVDALLMVASSAVAGAVLVVIGRAIAKAVAALNRLSRRLVPAGLALLVTVLLIVALGIVLGGVGSRALIALANSIYAPVNAETNEGTLPPDSSSVSGSSESYVAWNTLGRMGRDFVASATTAHQLETFHGGDAVLADPVRAYVGVDSAASAEERAELAVRELERAGGFERKVLVVWVPTGSGWMIPESAVALEQLHRGDTAIVAIQYSFLPSLLSVFLDTGQANDAGTTLFRAVHARWSALPPDQRPMLVLFGKSLGTAGVEAPFVGGNASSSVANVVARTDGALIVGAKQRNPIHSQLTREREPGSPVWQPVFDGGRTVRFLSRDPNQPALDADWPAPRMVYLQYPSDPVAFWSVEALWRPPDWMDRPRGYDVPDDARWFPIVSAVQAVGDMILQLSIPPGFGHDYSTDYVNGWAQVVPPDGWTDADTERLTAFLDTGKGESEP